MSRIEYLHAHKENRVEDILFKAYSIIRIVFIKEMDDVCR